MTRHREKGRACNTPVVGVVSTVKRCATETRATRVARVACRREMRNGRKEGVCNSPVLRVVSDVKLTDSEREGVTQRSQRYEERRDREGNAPVARAACKLRATRNGLKGGASYKSQAREGRATRDGEKGRARKAHIASVVSDEKI